MSQATRSTTSAYLVDRAKDLTARFREAELFDRSYQIAAMTFVALIPLILIISTIFVGGQEGLARLLIDRLGLVGFAAEVVTDMMRNSPGGIHWLGLVLTVYSAFSLSRRVSRAYNTIWRTAQLTVAEQWRGLAWVGIQVAMTTIVITLRGLLVGDHGVVLRILTVVLVLGVWFGAEYLSQRLLTHGAVAHERLLLAAGLTALGRIGIVVWSLTYLAHSLSEQAEQFGALGVVFSLFTYFLASTVVMLVATMLAAVFTEPRNGQDAVPVPATPSD